MSKLEPIETDKKFTFKKVTHFISSVLLYAVLALIAVIAIMFIAYFVDQQVGKSKGEVRNPLFSAYIIISPSMIPRINVNDAVVTIRASEKNIKVGDIITFLSKDIDTKGTPITHRVVGIVYEDEEKKEKVVGYRTKGDANPTQDFALIKPEEVLGKVFLRIPLIGYIQMFLTKPIGWVLVIVLPCLLIIGSDVMKLLKITDKNEEEEEKETKEKRGKKK